MTAAAWWEHAGTLLSLHLVCPQRRPYGTQPVRIRPAVYPPVRATWHRRMGWQAGSTMWATATWETGWRSRRLEMDPWQIFFGGMVYGAFLETALILVVSGSEPGGGGCRGGSGQRSPGGAGWEPYWRRQACRKSGMPISLP